MGVHFAAQIKNSRTCEQYRVQPYCLCEIDTIGLRAESGEWIALHLPKYCGNTYLWLKMVRVKISMST